MHDILLITDLKAREIIDSRSNPTIEVDLEVNNTIRCSASVPSGASTGILEALEKRDNDSSRFNGKGLIKIVNNINSDLKKELIGKKFVDQKELDNFLINLDATSNKSNLGANVILAISISFARCLAKSRNMDLYRSLALTSNNKKFIIPNPMINVINGGAHADNNLSIQEFMITIENEGNFISTMQKASEIFYNLKNILKKYNLSVNVGDEGGFAPQIDQAEDALKMLVQSIGKYEDSVKIALDAASSEFFKHNKYVVDNRSFDSTELIDYYEELTKKFPIISIEDPIAENDIDGWKKISERLNDKLQIVGDDLFVTNSKILQKGINEKIANAIIIKPNQIGTVTETIDTIKLAKNNNYIPIVSHRSGDTEDTFISHLAVGTGCKWIKTGSISRGERTAKYNELIRIEESIEH
ncbi:phosphopyruvate hydratase [Anaplasmataceae bacterium AB001_6]|nr:phosphopyruvate hydratase [Anaplasmataceae bacterium AB001_6]